MGCVIVTFAWGNEGEGKGEGEGEGCYDVVCEEKVMRGRGRDVMMSCVRGREGGAVQCC